VKDQCVSISQLTLVPDKSFNPDSSELSSRLRNLYNTLASIENADDIFDASFADYVFFPISHLLRKPALGDLTTEYVFKILDFLIIHAWSKSLEPELAKQLLVLFTFLVGGAPSPKDKINDKLKLNETGAAGCNAINSLFLAVAGLPKVHKVFSDGIDELPSLGHTVTVLLDCAVLGDKNIELQINSLKAMITLASNVFKSGDVLAALTPGIVSAITKILSQKNGGKRNYKVLVKALDLFAVTLIKVFNDQDLNLHKKDDTIPSDIKSFRTNSWLSASQSQVKISLNTFSYIRTHTRTEVLSALLRFSLDLLTSSLYALGNCVSILVDNVVFIGSLKSIVDPSLVSDTLFQFGVLLKNNTFIRDSLKERMYEWISSLPRLLSNHDESQALLILNVIVTGIKLLSSFASSSSAEIEYFELLFSTTLQDALSLKITSKVLPTLLPQHNELSNIATSTDLVLSKNSGGLFKDLGLRLANDLVEIELVRALSYFGSITTSTASFENLMMQVQKAQSPSYKALLTWMSINFFKGLVFNRGSEVDQWLLTDDGTSNEALTKPQKDDAAIAMYTFCSDILTTATSSLNVVKGNERFDDALLCIALEGIEQVAAYMGTDFQTELMDVLYGLVDFLGSSNSVVRATAQRAIISVARSCEYPDVRTLLVENSDYIIDTLSIKLNTLDFSVQGPVNLATLVKLSGVGIIPYLDDVIGSLFSILDNYHGYSSITSGVFQALESVVEETSKAYDQKLLDDVSQGDPITIESRFQYTSDFDSLLKRLDAKPEVPDFGDKDGANDDFLKHDGKPFKSEHKNVLTEVDSDDEDEDFLNFKENEVNPTTSLDNPQEQELKKWKSPVPKASYEQIQKIVGYTDRFLTHESANLRNQLLQLTATALPVLASNQELFLPSVNDIWPFVVSQLEDTEVFILEAALKLIGLLCQYARDFMTTRVTAVWSKLKTLLPSTARSRRRAAGVTISVVSKRYQRVEYPKFSSEQRILDAVLDCLALITKYTRLETTVFYDILDSVSIYLDDYKELANSLDEINSDAVWFEMKKNSGHPEIALDIERYPQFIPFVI
jgi:hypothetical protein